MRISFRQIFASLLILTLYAGGLRIVFRPDSASAASAPNIVGYQGRVLNANGVPVSDASATMIFRLYDADSAGNCLWSNSSTSCASATGMSVTLTDGMFAVQLGDTGSSFAAIPDTVFSDNATVYLQVTIGGETLSPRTRLTAAPYAMNSDTLDGVDSTGFVNTTTGCTDCLDFTSLADTLALDASTSITNGTSTLSMNLDNTGEFIIKDNGTAFAAFKGADSIGGAAQIYLRPNGTPNLLAFPDMGSFMWLDARDVTAGGMGIVWVHAPNLSSGNALSITQDLQYAAYGLGGTEPATVSSTLVNIGRNFDDSSSSVSGYLLRVDNSGSGTDPLTDSTVVAEFSQSNPNGSGNALSVTQDGSGTGLTIQQNGSGDGIGLVLASASSAANAVQATIAGTGSGLYVNNSNASGRALVAVGARGSGPGAAAEFSNSGAGSVISLTNGNTGATDPLIILSSYGDTQAISILDNDAGGAVSNFKIQADTENYLLDLQNSESGGSTDARQGILLKACATVPGSGCNYISFLTGNSGGAGAIAGNGAGGLTYGSSGADYAELFPGIAGSFSQGDVLALDSSGSIKLAVAGDSIAGAFSAAPNTLGNWRKDWESAGTWVPVSLLGQVPVRVSDANGPIAAGDFLMIGSVPGALVRATSAGNVLGQALESWSTGTGTISAFVRPQWYGGSSTLLGSVITGSSDVDTLAPEASVINLAGAHLTNVASITGLSGAWEITEDGNIRIRGRFTEITRGHNGTDVETHGITSLDTLVQLSGSAHIQEGLAVITFNDVDPKFAQVISPSAAYRVLVTPRDNVGNVYVSQSDNQGFTLSASSGGAGTVDYLVIAYNKDFEPENAAVPPPAEPVIGSSSGASIDAPAPDPVVTSDPAPEPAPSDAPVESPAPEPAPTPTPEPAPEPIPEPVPTP